MFRKKILILFEKLKYYLYLWGDIEYFVECMCLIFYKKDKVMKRITFFIISIFCLTACDNDAPFDNENGLPLDSKTQISLFLPDAAEVKVYSTATVLECRINNIWVMEFNSSGDTVRTEYITSGIANNGQPVQLLPQLSFEPANGNRIVCIANTFINSKAQLAGLTYGNINDKFPLDLDWVLNPDSPLNPEFNMPMYGEFIWSTANYTCQMVRAMAKIEVQMGTNVQDVTGNFNAETVTFKLGNSPKTGFMKDSIILGRFQGKQGTSDFLSLDGNDIHLLQKHLPAYYAGEPRTKMYVPEFPSSDHSCYPTMQTISDADFNKGRPHLLLTKKVGAIETMYRLDFYDKITKKHIDIKRNHHYIFTINKVMSEGYATAADAMSYPGSNVDFTIKVDDDSRSVTSNGQYAIITDVDTAFVSGTVSNQVVAKVKAFFPTEMSSITSFPNISATVTSGTGLSVSSLSSGDPRTPRDIIITTTGSFTEGVITITCGNIKHRLPVKKS